MIVVCGLKMVNYVRIFPIHCVCSQSHACLLCHRNCQAADRTSKGREKWREWSFHAVKYSIKLDQNSLIQAWSLWFSLDGHDYSWETKIGTSLAHLRVLSILRLYLERWRCCGQCICPALPFLYPVKLWRGKGVLNRKCDLVLSNCPNWSCHQVWAASDWRSLLSPRQIFPSLDSALTGHCENVLWEVFIKADRWVKLHSIPMQWNFVTQFKAGSNPSSREGIAMNFHLLFFSFFWMRRGTELLAKVSWRLWHRWSNECVIKNSIQGKRWQTTSAKGFLAPGREDVHPHVGSLPVPIIQEELSPSPLSLPVWMCGRALGSC